MADVTFTPPEPLTNDPRADRRVVPGSAGWLSRWRAWRTRTRPPSAADWEEANRRLLEQGLLILRLETQLAVATAAKDAAVREVGILSNVCTRNQERVEAERATASALREKAIAEAAGFRGVRASGGGGDD